MKQALKMYVFADVLRDWSSGLAVALASNKPAAISLILDAVCGTKPTRSGMNTAQYASWLRVWRERRKRLASELRKSKPDVHTEPAAAYVHGGS